MKKILFIILLASMAAYAKSGISFDRTEFDFGTIQEGATPIATFTFRNTGNSVLVIERIKTSCGCTSTLLSKKELDPGEQGVLEITFDSEGYNGLITRTITVLTNDPANKEVKLKIKATVTGAGK